MQKHVYLWMIIFIAPALQARQEYDSISYEDVKAILRTYHQSFTNDSSRYSSPMEFFDQPVISHDDYSAKILGEELKMIKSDVGLSFSATVRENLEDGIDENTQNMTRRRMTAGLDWHLLSGGYYQNRLKARMKGNELRIHQLEEAQKNRETSYYLNYNLIIYLHNQAKIQLFERRIALLEAILAFYHDLHASHLIDRKALMDIDLQLEQARKTRKSQIVYNKKMENDLLGSDSLHRVNVTQWPVFDINLGSLLSENGANDAKEENLRLQQDNLLLESQTGREWQFKLFARYTVNWAQIEQSNRQYPTVGATLQVPIHIGKGQRSQLYQYKAKQLESVHHVEHSNLKKELMNHYYEYQYHLKQYTQFLGKKDYYDYSIKLDSTALSYDLHLISPLQLLDHTLARSAVELELLDLRQQLYLKLLKMYTLSEVGTLADFVKPVRPSGEQASLALVIDTLPKSPEFLEAYLNLHNIEKLWIKSNDPDLPPSLEKKTEKLTDQDLTEIFRNPSREFLSVSEFSSKSALDQRIRDLSQRGVKQIILDNWEQLVELEMSTLND